MNEQAFDDLWLEAEGAQEDGAFVIRRLPSDGKLGNFVGVEGPQARRLMVIELGLDDSAMKTIPSWNVVDISYVRGAEFGNSIQIKLLAKEFRPHFTRLARDIHERTVPVQSPAQRLDALTKTLREWKTFVEGQRGRLLTDEEERGLLAEIHFLRRHLIPAVGAGAALTMWRGPQGARHDFQSGPVGSPKCCVEVKSNSPEKATVRISSSHQLDEEGTQGLWLYVLTLQPVHIDGENLPEAADTLFADCGDYRTLAISLLSQSGYQETDAGRYPRRFMAVGEAAYRVDDHFPRIVKPTQGVEAVRYSVNLAHASGSRFPVLTAVEGLTVG